MTIYKVEQLKNKNQFVIYADNKVIFQSYNSIIAIIDHENYTFTLGYNWDYSITTLKHLYLFLLTHFNAFYHELDLKNSKNKRLSIQKYMVENNQFREWKLYYV